MKNVSAWSFSPMGLTMELVRYCVNNKLERSEHTMQENVYNTLRTEKGGTLSWKQEVTSRKR